MPLGFLQILAHLKSCIWKKKRKIEQKTTFFAGKKIIWTVWHRIKPRFPHVILTVFKSKSVLLSQLSIEIICISEGHIASDSDSVQIQGPHSLKDQTFLVYVGWHFCQPQIPALTPAYVLLLSNEGPVKQTQWKLKMDKNEQIIKWTILP